MPCIRTESFEVFADYHQFYVQDGVVNPPVIPPKRIAIQDLSPATGHGTLGLTMAARTGRLMADWMGRRWREIETEELTVEMYC